MPGITTSLYSLAQHHQQQNQQNQQQHQQQSPEKFYSQPPEKFYSQSQSSAHHSNKHMMQCDLSSNHESQSSGGGGGGGGRDGRDGRDDESDSELEFINSSSGGHNSSSSSLLLMTTPFQPQRCSTPLQQHYPQQSMQMQMQRPMQQGSQAMQQQHYTDYGAPRSPASFMGMGHDRVCASSPDYQVSSDYRSPIATRKMPISVGSSPNAATVRNLPSGGGGSPVVYGMVPDYSISSGISSGSSMASFSSCGGGGRTDSPIRVPSAGAGVVYDGVAAYDDFQPDHRTMACCGSGSGSPLVSDFVRASGGRSSAQSGSVAGGMMSSRDNRWNTDGSVERQAQAYRLAASICVPNVVWSGILPARNSKGSAYSCKVFLGGVPWDITEANLNVAFGKFGQLKVEWPSSHSEHSGRNSKGYLYIIFDNERSVRALLQACTQDLSQNNRNYYFKVCSNRLRRKDVQVIPWQLADSTYVRNGCISAFGTKTVFVGSLHGMLNAEGLARIMDDLFGGVVAANVDTDKHKYPIGSGRVVFNCTHSYVKAIRAAFVELRTQKFSKKIQIDPFLEDSMCSICNAQVGPFFCRDMECFQYFCGTCWQWQHSVDSLKQHTPMMRNPRTHEGDF
ncbi:Cytoplasmic polyadenylation element-binding protein 1-B [Hypsibius exemplaris]|uniref:Cytoplasmic polyadenylation element-binding protein 1-B n=1 Tax=Hypsibius exemplaris TaxID=2072580 RepID=A0A1W0W8V8_HYPEX|nr:Cytoplasmic polyadenylation element-binding protein 1-B [Hypsibius exemplaris]